MEIEKTIETEPRQKFLIINVDPDGKPHILIAKKMFGRAATVLISGPEKGKLTNFERSINSSLDLPETPEDFVGIVISGSPYQATAIGRKEGLVLARWKKELIDFVKSSQEKNIPILGVCFGAQIVAEAMGGKVVRMKTREGNTVLEVGFASVKRTADSYGDPVMEGIGDEFLVSENHKFIISRLPPGGRLLAENEFGVQAFRIGNSWGVEFHPERNKEGTVNVLKNKKLDTPENIAKGDTYSGESSIVFQNFLKYAWKNKQ